MQELAPRIKRLLEQAEGQWAVRREEQSGPGGIQQEPETKLPCSMGDPRCTHSATTTATLRPNANTLAEIPLGIFSVSGLSGEDKAIALFQERCHLAKKLRRASRKRDSETWRCPRGTPLELRTGRLPASILLTCASVNVEGGLQVTGYRALPPRCGRTHPLQAHWEGPIGNDRARVAKILLQKGDC